MTPPTLRVRCCGRYHTIAFHNGAMVLKDHRRDLATADAVMNTLDSTFMKCHQIRNLWKRCHAGSSEAYRKLPEPLKEYFRELKKVAERRRKDQAERDCLWRKSYQYRAADEASRAARDLLDRCIKEGSYRIPPGGVLYDIRPTFSPVIRPLLASTGFSSSTCRVQNGRRTRWWKDTALTIVWLVTPRWYNRVYRTGRTVTCDGKVVVDIDDAAGLIKVVNQPSDTRYALKTEERPIPKEWVRSSGGSDERKC